MTDVIIVKNNHRGEEVWRYGGTIVERGPTWIKLEATYTSPDRVTEYHTFRHGDHFVEWFYSDRWYSIFQMYDVDDGRLKGWYCNISRPAVFANGTIAADDWRWTCSQPRWDADRAGRTSSRRCRSTRRRGRRRAALDGLGRWLPARDALQ